MQNFKSGIYDTNIGHQDAKKDGFRLCEQIKRIDREVCFITASEDYCKEHFSELKKEGCFMQKPISLDDLVNRINLVLSNQ